MWTLLTIYFTVGFTLGAMYLCVEFKKPVSLGDIAFIWEHKFIIVVFLAICTTSWAIMWLCFIFHLWLDRQGTGQ